jgi:hypothetical protein
VLDHPGFLQNNIERCNLQVVVNSMGAGAWFEAFNKLLLTQTTALALLYYAGTRNRRPTCTRIRRLQDRT